MSKRFIVDWYKVKDAFDGDMPECKGGKCSTPCCNLKSIREWNGPVREYRTTVECDEYIATYNGNLPGGVTMTKVDIGDDRSNIRYLVNGCLGDDGECRLESNKPVHCRMYPFRPGPLLPIDLRCPSAHEIAANNRTVDGVMRLKESLGCTTTETWYLNLIDHLKSRAS